MRVRPLSTPWFAVPAVLLFFFLALNSLVGDSPTMDEQNHIARGLAFLRTGDPRFSLEHPPLVNSLSALPLLTVPGIRLPLDHPSWEHPEGWYQFADLLMWEVNHDATRMVILARMPILFLMLGLALVSYQLARQIWGRAAAPFAFLLTLFDPNILAHGRYATTDVGGTMFLFLAVLMVWRMWRVERWSWSRWLAAVLSLGLAFSSKLSTLAFVPILAVMAWLPVDDRPWRWRDGWRRMTQLGSAGLLSLVVVWASFGFQWGTFRFRSDVLAGLNHLSGPMPTFWAGIEQIAGFTGGGRGSAFLLGRFSDHGFRAYFPVAFLVKTPIPILLLLLGAAVLLLKRPDTRRGAAFLLLPATLYFALSMQSALNIGYRHLLPMLPFLYVLSSGLALNVTGSSWLKNRLSQMQAGWTPGTALLALALAGVLIADMRLHPHYLSAFNSAAGGPDNGYQILVDSNIDWGQDLIRLKRWMQEHQVPEVKLAWFGSADPGYYGIRYQPLPGIGRSEFWLWWDVPFNTTDPEPGVYAISVTNLWELPLREEEKNVYAWFRAHEPDDRIGYSILIYDIH